MLTFASAVPDFLNSCGSYNCIPGASGIDFQNRKIMQKFFEKTSGLSLLM
jgi:hypothetical protein